jgi:two-component system sensor histidine kinase BaeS
MADEAGVTLTIATDAGTGDTIEADPVRLSEVLTNLLTNAIRHTPPDGTVTIRVATSPSSATFEVDDTGPGIDVDQLPVGFDRFVTSADAGGTGLGLAIAKRLVTAHGGTIEARPSAAGGTTIAFTIPSA